MSMDRTHFHRPGSYGPETPRAEPPNAAAGAEEDLQYPHYAKLLKSERSLRVLNEHLMAPLILFQFPDDIAKKLQDAGKFNLKDLLNTTVQELGQKNFTQADLDEVLRGIYIFVERARPRMEHPAIRRGT